MRSKTSPIRPAFPSEEPPPGRGKRFQHIFHAISDMVVLIEREPDGGYRCVEANQAVSRMEGIPLEAILGRRVDEIHPPDVYAEWKAIYDKVVETRRPLEVEHEVKSPLGLRHRITRFQPMVEEDGSLRFLLGVCQDVTETRTVMRERDAHLRCLEGMDRINRVLSTDLDAERVLQEATAVLLDLFGADRAWLADACDPDSPVFRLPFITCRPEFPGPPRGAEVPMDPVSGGIVREVLATDGPLAFDESHPMPGGRTYLDLFGIRSQLLMAIRPATGTAWCVGLHQCSRERRWTEEDRALFHDVVLRIKATLDNLLLHRDLKRSRDFHHLVTELQPQLLWTADAAGKMEFVNRRWMEFTGQDWETGLGDGGLLALHPDDRLRAMEAWNRSLVTGEPYEIELRYRRVDGSFHWHLTRAYPIRGEDGAVTRWIGTCTDIDGTKRMQAEADRARAELEVILEGVDEGISAQSPDGRLIYSNRKFAEISGYPNAAALLSAPLEERIGRYGLYDESGEPIPWPGLPGRRVLAGEDHAQMVMRVVDMALASERWVIAKSSAVRDPDGKVAMAINFTQDITAARAAEEALGRSRSQLSAILAGISEAIVAQEPDGRIIYANDAAARLFDLSTAEELMQLSAQSDPDRDSGMLTLFDEAGAPLRVDELPSRKARQGIETPPMILRFRFGEQGRERWVIARAKPLFDAEGKVSLVIGMTQDITALREREEAMRRLQKMESLGKLAGGIAHDFNNLLVTINGYSELGLAAAEGREGLEEYFREILASGRRAASLTQQLLAYSRKQIIQPKPLKVNAVVSEMERMIKRLIGEEIRVETRLAEGLPTVEFDPSQLEQVILNLVVNARDAMPEGGELALETALSRLDGKALEGQPEARPGPYVTLSVSDTGMGMSPEVLERAFEPFFTTKPVGKGTGLGLSSVYGMVRQGGGHILARSEPGAGSSFTVCLPAAEVPAQEELQAPREQARQPRGAAGTVLLVEDEPTVRNFARLVLEGWGYRVVAAQDGMEALERAKSMEGLSLLLTDVVMPRMRGTALMAEVRKIHPAARVVLMSGYPDQGDLSDGSGGEAPRFLQKPFRVEDLAEAVGSLAASQGRD